MDTIISQGARISHRGEYPLSRQQKCHVVQDQWMQEYSHHLNIQYFYIADQKAKGHIDIR